MHPFDQRPIVVAIAGPNGAGKSTFFHAHLANAGLRFINADELARELDVDAYAAASIAHDLRVELVRHQESFVFETVFSDPKGDKLDFLQGAVSVGYTVVLCFIGLDSAKISDDRVAMRVLQGGHDVPHDKVIARFPRVMRNLKRAARTLPHVIVYDNSDLRHPYRKVAQLSAGRVVEVCKPVPRWLTLPR